jgi:hypothetical protein
MAPSVDDINNFEEYTSEALRVTSSVKENRICWDAGERWNAGSV